MFPNTFDALANGHLSWLEHLPRYVCDQDETICRDESIDPASPFCCFYDTVFIRKSY